MGFELGKYYKHTRGLRMHICGICETETYGRCLIGEDHEGNLSPVNDGDDAAINFHEIGKEEFLDGVKREGNTGTVPIGTVGTNGTAGKLTDWKDNPVSPAQQRFIKQIYKIVKGVPRFTGRTKQEAYAYIEKWKDAYFTEMSQLKAKGKTQKQKGE